MTDQTNTPERLRNPNRLFGLLALSALLAGGLLVACGPDQEGTADTLGNDSQIVGETGDTDAGFDLDATTETGENDALLGDTETRSDSDLAVGGADVGGAGDIPVVVTLGETLNVVEADAPARAANEGELELAVGERYEFRSEGEGDLVLENLDGDPLLASGDQEGTFEADSNVAFEESADGVMFTLTDELASELAALSQNGQRIVLRVLN